uniref:Immunoglobulin V-set domain-containing protein n=1 Tax=Xenopus tropicalis TaxID=8364 RepID=A0A803JTK3_XENTR
MVLSAIRTGMRMGEWAALLDSTLLFSLCAGGIHSQGKKPYCIIQNESVRVREGGSVTIPCWFSYPRNQWDSSVSLRVYWRAARERPCGSNPFIYNHTENWVHGDYTGRISLEGNPKEQNVVSLRIQGIRRSDGPIYKSPSVCVTVSPCRGRGRLTAPVCVSVSPCRGRGRLTAPSVCVTVSPCRGRGRLTAPSVCVTVSPCRGWGRLTAPSV